MPLGLLRIISVLPSASAMEIAARKREYGSTGIRKHGRRRHGHVQWLSLEFNLLASEIFLAVPMCRQCGFYGYSRACRSDVAPCAPGSRIPVSPPPEGVSPMPPIRCQGIVMAAFDFDLQCGENTTRYLNSSLHIFLLFVSNNLHL